MSRTMTVRLTGDPDKFASALESVASELELNISGGTVNGVEFSVEWDDE